MKDVGHDVDAADGNRQVTSWPRSPVALKSAILTLVALQLILVGAAVAVVGWRHWFASDLPEEPRTVNSLVAGPVDLESAFPIAVARARKWDDKPKLILVSAQIDWPLDVPIDAVTEPPGGGWLTYVFLRGRPGDDEALCLLIERYSGRIVQEVVAEWGATESPVELNLLALPISSTDALLAAEAAAGSGFRRACPEARHQTRISLGMAPLSLRNPARVPDDAVTPLSGGSIAERFGGAASTAESRDDNAPSWLLGYRDVRDRGVAPVRVGVRASDGEVTVESRDVPATEGCAV